MNRKTVSGITLTLLFIGMLTLTFNIQRVRADGNLHFRLQAPVEVLPEILIVADDDADSMVYGTSLPEFESALTAEGYNYTVWCESSLSNPSLDFLTNFELVIWTCGDYWDSAVDSTDASVLESYLAQGGNILLEGEDVGFDHHADGFMVNVAHAIYQVDGTGAPGLTVTDPTHPVTQSLPSSFLWLKFPPYDDGVTPTNGGFEVIRYTNTSWTAVTVFDGAATNNGSVVYYAFPLFCLRVPERRALVASSVGWFFGKPDLEVSLATPLFVEPDASVLLNATLCNKGARDEVNVDLVLLIDDGVVCNQTFPVLKVGQCQFINFSWAPAAEGIYIATAYTPPVQNETRTENNIASKYVYVGVSPPPRRFRLLAVEQMFDTCRMGGAQFLIKELLNYPNWNNSTDQYVSHIHLLSLYNSTEVYPALKDYLRGKPSLQNVRDEFINFLGQAVPGEIVIFYYNGHSVQYFLSPDRVEVRFLGISSTALNNWLMSGGLPQASVTVILDTCYSEYWTEVLPNCNVLAACKLYQFAWGWCGEGGFFTEGLIEGFWVANESNNDGWLSAEEVFAYAKPYTQSLAETCGLRQNPTCYYGIVEGDVPLVQRDETKPFPLWDIAVTSVEVLAEDVMKSGLPVLINVTVENQGIKPGIFNVTIYYNTSFIETTKVTLNPQENITLEFSWNTTGLDGIFQIFAEVGISPGEVDILDNTYLGGVIRIARPPIITVNSPENMTYSIGPIPLSFIINEAPCWIGYSLDDQANVTITANTTLINFPIGIHKITVYANDTYGDMGSSDTVYFTIICDLNGDGKVDITDIYIVILAFGSYPSHPGWNPIADVDKDNTVDVRDIYLVITNFGKTT